MPVAFGAALGRLFLLKITNLTSPVNYQTIGGLKATSMSVGNEVVDITTKDEAPWKTLLANAGIRSVALAGSGVCKDTVAEDLARTFAFSGAQSNFELTDQAGDTCTGAFLVTKFEWTGAHNGAQEYSISFESTGVVTFTPHV